MYQCEIITDSINVAGNRLTTFHLVYPRIIHAEMLRHRSASRSVSSSRAIPVKRMIERIQEQPYVPADWRMNEPGMQGWTSANDATTKAAVEIWLDAAHSAIVNAKRLNELGIHKQHVNRLLEPFAFVEEVVSATEWRNFFKLRTASDADPAIQVIANMMLEAYEASQPVLLQPEQWHLPYVREDEEKILKLYRVKISAARCARVSYTLRNGKPSDLESDMKLFNGLAKNAHWSPMEHPAEALDSNERIGNFVGWRQLRKLYDGESGGDYS